MTGERRRAHALCTVGRCAAVALAAALAVGFATEANPPGDAPQHGVTFASIAHADSELCVRTTQIRRVREQGGAAATWAGLVERLVTAPGPAGEESRFQLDFLGIEGGTNVSTLDLERRRQLYHSQAAYLYRYASLRIDDPDRAARNYLLLHLDDRTRLGRPTHRVVLLPRRLGRSAWVLEIDAATSFPLFRAEFDVAGNLVATLEVTSFEVLSPAATSGVQWWQPARRMEDHASIPAALATLPPAPFTAPRSTDLPIGYDLADIQVVREDLRPEASLVLTYSDGIDEIFVIGTFNAPPPALPVSTGRTGAYAIFVYQDHNVSQLMFHANRVTTLVVGRSGQFALAPLAHDLLARSLHGG